MLALGRGLLDALFAYVSTSVSTISGFIYTYFRVLKNEQSNFNYLHAPLLFSFFCFAEPRENCLAAGQAFPLVYKKASSN